MSDSTHPTAKHRGLSEPLLRCLAQNKRGFDGCELIAHRTRLAVARPKISVFNDLRNLANLALWWPRAVAVRALPPGVFGIGDVGVLELQRESAWFRVMAYQANRRLVLALVLRHDLLIVDLRISGDLDACVLELCIEAPRHRAALSNLWQALWIRLLCTRVASRLSTHLCAEAKHASSVSAIVRFPHATPG